MVRSGQAGWVGAALCGIGLLGCATPYQAGGFQGGYSVRPVTEDTFQISFEGNVPLDRKVLQQSLLRRAAEVTLEHGYTHFALLSRSGNTGIGFVLRPGILGPIRQTGRSIVVQCYRSHTAEHGALDARQVLEGSPDYRVPAKSPGAQKR